MPTLKRFGATTVRMYADDHRPSHVHIVGADFEVLVRIADLEVTAGSARPSQVAQAMEWVASQGSFLAAKWTELNERR